MLSIIVPTYNEEKNIQVLLSRLGSSLDKRADYEIIVVDDNSVDGTWETLEREQNNYPLRFFKKEGKRGKSFSLVEGFQKARGQYLAFIDADLQYPPEAIVEILEHIGDSGADVVVGNRKKHQTKILRKLLSKTFRFAFGKVLFGLKCDIQSGLKVFNREVWETVAFTPHSAWSFDLEFLVRAKRAGYKIASFDINFARRLNGKSHISLVGNGFELSKNALLLKTKRIHPQHIRPKKIGSMHGAGVGFGGKKYITHTTLPHQVSALRGFLLWQKLVIATALVSLSISFYMFTLTTAIVLVAILSTIYLIDVLFNLSLILKSLHSPPEISFTREELSEIADKQLPTYTILCPLYKEAAVLSHFLSAVDKLDWPKDKLDVLLLLEEDDQETQNVIRGLSLPAYIRPIVVPESTPKTKPKACNYGLSLAQGKYVVIFDAEDRPEPLQLKKAFLAFSQTDKNVVCLQAKLNYYNPHQNLLTRLFTAEYSLWFDVTLTGLQSIGTAIPLGGTSNHFRTDDLIRLQGWDPFNVTEDADLGVRLFKEGYRTAIIDSTTLEEANSRLGNWTRQRSRWIKGYMQTYLVQMRNPISFARQKGIHSLFFQLTVGGKIAFIFINPFLWAATISYFALNHLVGPTIESLYPAPIFYMAVASLVFGNFMFMYYYMIGCAKRQHWQVIKYVFLIPAYWLFISFAAVVAAYQLIVKPHYWEKTVHGFHLAKVESDSAKVVRDQLRTEIKAQKAQSGKNRFLPAYALAKSGIATGGALIAASIYANFANFAYNAYLGRRISVEDFGLISLVGSFFYLSTVPMGALGKTVTHRTAFLLGRYEVPLKQFWSHVRLRAIVAGTAATLIWLVLTPLLAIFFKSPSWGPFLLFAPVWFIGATAAVDSGFLSGNLKFKVLAILIFVESTIKFLAAFAFVESGNSHLVYAATPIGMSVAFLAGWFFATRIRQQKKIIDSHVLNFPSKFFVTSIFTKFSTVAFLSFDLILAKHFLPPQQAGLYALLSLTGKMVFFSGSLFNSFINPFVSREEGAKGKSHHVFYKLFFASMFLSFVAYLVVGLFGAYTVPLLLGKKVDPILYLLPTYGLAMFCFSVADSLVTYYQVRRKYLFSIVSLFLAFAQILAIYFYHADLEEIVLVMTATGIMSLVVIVFLYLIYEPLSSLGRNLVDLFGIITFSTPKVTASAANLRILIFNWRDTKHVWAGGAEVYIHQIAKGFIKEGHSVTVFCGNDGKNARSETIDEVQIVRRGGFYTVYIWAALYYIFKLRGRFDLIIDSENGIPFFTPLYARIPIIGLIHHIHQEIHREHLSFPLSQIALFLEGKLMPRVYKNIKMVTISKSTKEAMEALGFLSYIDIVHPGVNLENFKPGPKTANPSIFYLGRLKPYKSIDRLISAFFQVARDVPNATLTIAGEGESRPELEEMVKKLGLTDAVKFLGKVEEKAKSELLASSWMLAQPSSMEGWGITVIEANAAGTPVIASDVPGLRDSVRNPHTGLLVTWDNQEKWTDAMVKVIRDNNFRKAMGTEAELWSKNFSWNKSSDKFLEVIQKETV